MSTAPRRPDLANEPVGRLMLRLSIPTITAQLVNMLYNLVDRIYISYIPDVGTLALTGLGVCLPIILLVSAFAALCASSGAPLASIAMGQRNHEKAEGILGSCTALLLCVSAVLTVVLSCFYTPILLAFGATEDALPYAQRYIAIYSLGTVFVQLSLGLNPFITAQGFSKAGMLTVLIGAVLNTLLDPLFIFVFHMDVQGAALATVISQAVSAAFVLRFLTGRQTILRLKRRLLRLNWKLLAPCVALGLAPFIMQSTESLVSVCFNTSLRAAGGTLAVGTMTICSTLMQFALLPLQGLSQGAQPIISFNYGAKRPERVKAAFRILLISCLAFSAVLGLTCIFAPQIFVYLLTPDAALRENRDRCAAGASCPCLFFHRLRASGKIKAKQDVFPACGARGEPFAHGIRRLRQPVPRRAHGLRQRRQHTVVGEKLVHARTAVRELAHGRAAGRRAEPERVKRRVQRLILQPRLAVAHMRHVPEKRLAQARVFDGRDLLRLAGGARRGGLALTAQRAGEAQLFIHRGKPLVRRNEHQAVRAALFELLFRKRQQRAADALPAPVLVGRHGVEIRGGAGVLAARKLLRQGKAHPHQHLAVARGKARCVRIRLTEKASDLLVRVAERLLPQARERRNVSLVRFLAAHYIFSFQSAVNFSSSSVG